MRKGETPKSRGQARLYNDVRLMAKRANQAMVRLERLGIKSPAYDYAQASLAVMGRRGTDMRGARFDERGVYTYNEMEYTRRILEKFLSASTRTQTGAKQWVENVWQGGNKAYDLAKHGVTRDDWLEFWKSMPASQKDRSLGSEVIVNLFRAYTMKNKELSDEQRLSSEEIARKIQESGDLKSAYRNLGLSFKDYQQSVRIGKNDTKSSEN